MSRILLLATTTGYQTRAFGDAAERLGVELVFATDRCDMLDDPWRDGAIAIRFHDEDRSVSAIVDAVRDRPLDGVLVVGDRPTVIAAQVAKALGIAGHPPESAEIAGHKLRTRKRLRAAGLPVPWFEPLSIGSKPASVSFPCVIKPAALSGSRGVMRADDEGSLGLALDRVSALLASPDVMAERNHAHRLILVEGFVPGRKYAIEGVLHRGDFHLLAVFDKPDPLDGPLFEETIYVTPSSERTGTQRRIAEAVEDAARALGLHHGPIHAECRVNDRGVFVLEVAARPIGGLCARALRFDPGGIALEELLLRHALGESPARWRLESRASGVMMIPIPRRGILRGVEGVDEARGVAHVEDVRVTAKMDQLLVPLPEGASYLGFIFARADDPREVERALRAAHARLRLVIDPEVPMYNHKHG